MNPSPQCMDDELSLDASGGPVLGMPKQALGDTSGMTPLDDCLAQLTSETAPSLRIPGTDGVCLASAESFCLSNRFVMPCHMLCSWVTHVTADTQKSCTCHI